MDNRQLLTNFLLIFLMLTIYFQFFVTPPQSEKSKKEAQKTDVAQKVAKSNENYATVLKDSAKTTQLLGDFASLFKGTEKKITLDNQDVKISFSTKGGRVQEVRLKKYQTDDKKPLILTDENSKTQILEVKTIKGQIIDLYSLYYEASEPRKEGTKTILTFTASIATDKKVVQTYTLASEGYLLDYDLKFQGLTDVIPKEIPARLSWQDKLKRFETDLYQTRYYTTVNFSTAKGEFDYLTYPSEDRQERKPETKLHWVSFKQRFFTQAIIAKNKNLANAELVKSGKDTIDKIIKTVQASFDIPSTDLHEGKGQFQYYFGPNRHQNLNATKIEQFGRNLYLGWDIFGFFAVWVVMPIFSLLEGITSNYGIILILLVFIVKMLVLPLTYGSNKAMARMKVINDLIKPELDAFKKKEKLEGDFLDMAGQQKVQQEQMRLQQQLGVSPFAALGGCLPILLQTPIFIAMFLFVPGAIELRQASFLWAHDLSTFDAIIKFPFTVPFMGAHLSLFTILMTVSTIALTYYTNQAQPQMQQGMMKYMGYIMPLMFLFVLNSSPAGLSLYYFVQNMMSIGQQNIIQKYFIDTSKIVAGYEAYKKDNKDKATGKTKMQLWLEEAQKKAQERAEAKKNKKK